MIRPIERNVRDRVPFVDLAAQNAAHTDDVVEILRSLSNSSDWILGDEVSRFEADYAEYCGARFAIGTDSGLSALELTLRALGVGEGDEVLTAANTFIATALAISHTGAKPVLVDADPDRYTIDPNLLRDRITPRTRAIIPVHLYGQPAAMESILAVAQEHDLFVIEDACQAHGARYENRRTGALGHAAAFSFYPSKNLGAYGDGGIVVTSDEGLAQKLRVLRNYGQEQKYLHAVKGYNRRLDTLHAAILRMKLKRLDACNALRREHAEAYNRLLEGTDLVVPTVAGNVEPVWHLYVVRTERRDKLRAHLEERGIQTGIHYPIPVHLQPAYCELGCPLGSYPVSEMLAEQVLSLPMYPELDPKSVEYVAKAVAEFFRIGEER